MLVYSVVDGFGCDDRELSRERGLRKLMKRKEGLRHLEGSINTKESSAAGKSRVPAARQTRTTLFSVPPRKITKLSPASSIAMSPEVIISRFISSNLEYASELSYSE